MKTPGKDEKKTRALVRPTSLMCMLTESSLWFTNREAPVRRARADRLCEDDSWRGHCGRNQHLVTLVALVWRGVRCHW